MWGPVLALLGRKGLQSPGGRGSKTPPALLDAKRPIHLSLYLWRRLVRRTVFLSHQGHLENKMSFYSLN